MQRSRDLSLASILLMQAISINNYFKDSSGLQIKAPLKLYRYAVQLLVRSRICYGSAFRLHYSDELFVTLLAPPVALSVPAMKAKQHMYRIGFLFVKLQRTELNLYRTSGFCYRSIAR